MKKLKPLLLIFLICIIICSCSQDDAPDTVPIPATIKLIPEMEKFTGNVGDTLEVTVVVEGEREFQSLRINKIINGSIIDTYFLIEDTGDLTIPPYHEIFKHQLDEEDAEQPYELEFRLDSRLETPSGGLHISYSSVSVLVITHE